MSKKLKTIIKIILWVIMGISLILFGWFYFGSDVSGTKGTNLAEPVATNYMLWWAYILFGLAVIITLIFALVNIFTNPGGAKKALVSLVIIAILVGVSYLLASNQTLKMPGYEGGGNTPVVLKWVGTGLIATYLLAAIAILAILYVEIVKIFK